MPEQRTRIAFFTTGKSFELIDTVPGDLAALGLTAGLVVTSQEPMIELSIVRSDLGANELLDIASDVALSVGYHGTTATLTITTPDGSDVATDYNCVISGTCTPSATTNNVFLSVIPTPLAGDRKSTRLNSSHIPLSRMPSSA